MRPNAGKDEKPFLRWSYFFVCSQPSQLKQVKINDVKKRIKATLLERRFEKTRNPF